MSSTHIEDEVEIADRLHSAAIHLLRRLRAQDAATGLSGRKLSALSVVVFAGPISIGALAEAEQVSAPTVSRLVKEMEWEGLVQRVEHPSDKRVQRIRATAKGEQILQSGRRRRVEVLAEDLLQLPPEQRATLSEAIPVLERLTLPPKHPKQQQAET